MRPLVLGTAGHIDHGKTSLVRALTGMDTDRLPDEKRRGITIDLGFASLSLPDGPRISIVDVPGHEAFIRNMVAGATGIDLVMLVIAADEGPMPQTREHLAILELLGIGRGVVALTKIDAVEHDWLELVRDEVRELISPTSLAGAPIIEVSARTAAGIDDLVEALRAAAATVPSRFDDDLFRLPIDRVFTVRGTGTIVTGTVWSGSLTRDEHARVLPAGFDARVRGLQQHGVACDRVNAGARAAVALAGVDRDAVTRGDTLLTGDGWSAAGTLTAQLEVLTGAPNPIRPRQRVRVHLGTAEVLARVALLHADLAPGDSAIVQLRLERPLVARAGDRFVMRSYSPVQTIGGGVVLEPVAPKRKRLAPDVRAALVSQDRITAAVTLAGAQGLERRLLPIVTGLAPDAADAALRSCERVTLAGERVVARDLLSHTESAIHDCVARFHQAEPMLDGIEREAVRRKLRQPPLFDAALSALLATGRIAATGNSLALPHHTPAVDPDARAAMQRLAHLFEIARLEPPELSSLPADLAERPDLPVLLRFLERDGTLLRLSATRLIHARAVSETVTSLRGQLKAGEPLGIAEFKDVLKLTRKHLIPLLEHFDRTGITRRAGESRILLEG